MSFLEPRVGFSSVFAFPVSLMRHSSSVQIARLFIFLSAPMKIFETTRPEFIQTLHYYSVSKRVTPLYLFSSNLIYFRLKEPIKVRFLDFLVVWWKFTKFLLPCLKLEVSFSLNFAALFIVIRDNSSVLFFSWNCIWFGQKEPIKVEISDFWLLMWNLT